MKLRTLAAVILFQACPLALQASALPNGAHIETSAIGSVEVAPDMATLIINVNTSSKQSAEAKKLADDRVAQYFSFLEKMGVNKNDIDAANITTSAEYNYSKPGSPELTGYRANRVVTVKLRELDKLNPILDGALDSQLNEISNIQLGVANPDVYKKQAREKAMQQAAEQAKSLAEGFGVKLGPVYRISYNVPDSQNLPVPIYRAKSAMMDSSAQVDATYQRDTIKFNDNVSVVFEIER